MKTLLLTAAIIFAQSAIFAADSASITAIEPTPLFPKPAAGQPLRQLSRLQVDNTGAAFDAVVRVTVGNAAPENQPVKVAKGKTAVEFLVPDIAAPTPVTIELLSKDGTVLASKKLDWQPQKKWTIYCCAVQPSRPRLRRLPAPAAHVHPPRETSNCRCRFCRETDDWPDDCEVPVQHRNQRTAHQFHQLQRQGRRARTGASACAKAASDWAVCTTPSTPKN